MSAFDSAPRPEPGDHAVLSHGWHWYAQRLGVGLIAAALLGLLWILHRQDLAESRAGVIRDILWVEQNVHASLDRDVERLREVALASPATGAAQPELELNVKRLLASSPGLLQVVLLDADGGARASAPTPSADSSEAPWVDARSDPAYLVARSSGKPAYAAPHAAAREHHLEVFVPYYRGGALAGTVVGVYGLRSLLDGLVPWWLAERHRVTIRDDAGAVLAAQSNIDAAGHPELTHQARLDPPGSGLVLHVASYGSGTKVLRNVLASAILSLSAAVLWSIWALRRHIQRRLETERALREEHAFRKSMEDSLHTGMRAVDLEGRTVYVNRAFCEMVGFSERDLIGHGAPQEYWPPEERDRIGRALRAARQPGAPRAPLELELVRRSGERFDVLLYEAPLVDAHGRQTGWMGSVLDVTERKRARERTRLQQEKLAATARLVTMGEMASTIAHELNQPLSAIASYSAGCRNLLLSGAADPAEIAEALEKTSRQAERAGRIIRRVHEFVRKNEPTRARVRINAVVEEAVGFAEPEARKRRVEVVSLLSARDPELDADPLLLQQVLLNLLRNGMDAMAQTPPDGRALTVTTERTGDVVTVSVADRGCGLSPEVRAGLFEPFFTTKAEGMGMGLNICRSILEGHGGRVWAEVNPGGGTVFSFSIPARGAP